MQRTIAMVFVGIGIMCGCGGAEQQPLVAPDRTAPGSERSTSMQTCKWTPPLPSDREDPCTHESKGATLELTERLDMREESRFQQTHTCLCD